MDARLQTVFQCLIAVQFVAVVAHDLVDIPGWTHGSQVQALIGWRELFLVIIDQRYLFRPCRCVCLLLLESA
jgi:hypothetical protein